MTNPRAQTLTFDNGLNVVLQFLPQCPAAAVVVSYRVGSRSERPGERGLSHFCEHMMFKGTPRVSTNRYWQVVERAGGVANAFTSRDMTAYFSVVPIRGVADVLDLEADRMLNCNFDEEEVRRERQVVTEERSMSLVDDPASALNQKLYEKAFTIHPYRNPIVGSEIDISGFTMEKARSFYGEFYRPDNCVLTVVGGFDDAEIREVIGRTFGPLKPSPPEIRDEPRPEPPQGELRRFTFSHPSNLDRFAMAFKVPPGKHRDNVLLGMLTDHLDWGRMGALQVSLQHPGLALDVAAGTSQGIDDGLLTIQVTVSPDVDPEEVEIRTWQEIESITSEALETVMVENLKARFETEWAFSQSTPAGRAMVLSAGATMFDDPYYTNELRKGVHSCTPELLLAAARRYLRRNRCTLVHLSAQKTISAGAPSPPVTSSETPDIQPPPVIDFQDLDIPDYLTAVPQDSLSRNVLTRRMDNGLLALAVERHAFPVVAVGLATGIAAVRESEELAGLSSVTTECMLRGTDGQSYLEFISRLERYGGRLSLSAGREYARGSAAVRPEHLDEALSVISDLLRRPSLDKDDFEKVRSEKKAELAQRHESPFGVAVDNLATLMLEPEYAARVPTTLTLGRMEPDHVRSFHRSCCRPSNTVLVVVGDVEAPRILDMLEDHFHDWTDPDTGLPEPDHGRIRVKGERAAVTMLGKKQTAILVGLAAPSVGSKDHYPFRILNWLLGDGIGSRLGQSLREGSGLTYTVGSQYIAGTEYGRLIGYASTEGGLAGIAEDLLLDEIDNMVQNPPRGKELRLAKAHAMGNHALDHTDYASVAGYLLSSAARGLPLDRDLRSLTAVSEMSTDDLAEVAARWLDWERAFLSIAGARGRE
ncbi:hypothetical protein GF402_08870 [Candidatus Fermentibacteria bacterium]|nr:hypothetical protein [Candidatus Fermentibacteria bacterium]